MIWGRKHRKDLEEAIEARKAAEVRAEEADQVKKKLQQMGRENHFANAIIENVLEGYGDK